MKYKKGDVVLLIDKDKVAMRSDELGNVFLPNQTTGRVEPMPTLSNRIIGAEVTIINVLRHGWYDESENGNTFHESEIETLIKKAKSHA